MPNKISVLVLFVGWTRIFAIELGSPDGLHFNYGEEYASTYDNYKPRDYKFEYAVSDPHTGDHKQHWEVRENGVVRGSYSLLEPDGTTRIVEYTADKEHGFRAVVKRIGHAIHPEPAHHHEIPKALTVPEVLHSLPYATSSIDATPYYKSYDGSVENYGNIIDDHSALHLPISGIEADLKENVGLGETLAHLPTLSDESKLLSAYKPLEIQEESIIPSEESIVLKHDHIVQNHEPTILNHLEIPSVISSEESLLHKYEPTVLKHIEEASIVPSEELILQKHEPIVLKHIETPSIISSEESILHKLEPIILPHEPIVLKHEEPPSIILSDDLNLHQHEPILLKHEEPTVLHQEPIVFKKEESVVIKHKEPSSEGQLTGLSSSSYIGVTGNLDDDSEYTKY